MTQPAIQVNAALVPVGENGLPVYMDVPLDASEQAAQLQYLTLDPSTGMAQLGDDATPSQISAGFVRVSELTDTDAVAGNARARVSWGMAVHSAPSTVASDTPGVADVGKPIWLAPSNAPGLLSHTGTLAAVTLKNRSLLGLALGLVKQGSTAIYHWVGPIAQAVARGVMMANAYPLAQVSFADAAANTATSEKAINRPRMHGTVTSVSYTGSALVVGDTDYVTINVSKRDGAGGGATTLATYDSRAAGNGAATAFVPKEFTLSVVAGALDLLEGDVVTVTTVKGNAGQVLTGTILINGKAI